MGPISQPTRTGSSRPINLIIAPFTAAGSNFVARVTQVSQPLEMLVWLVPHTMKHIRAGTAMHPTSAPSSRVGSTSVRQAAQEDVTPALCICLSVTP